MSDIRFNRWLHQSGTGGVYQVGSGNVGVGTSVPSTTLDVNGSISATSITATTGTITGNLTVEGVLTYDDVTNIDSVGVVTARDGIDITSGDIVLNKSRSDTHASLIIDKPDAGSGTIKFYNNGSDSGYIQHTNAEHLHYYLPSGSGYHAFYTNGNNERLRIASDGTVIVGTDTTVNPILRILGTSAHNSFIQFADGDSNNVGQLQYSHSSNALIVAVNGGEKLRITSDGKMGLGTQTPGQALSISGNSVSLGIYNTGNNHGNVYFYKDGTAKGWLKYRGNDDKLVIGNVTDAINVKTSGNVGVGNADPTQAKLVAQTASGMSIAAVKDNTGASISLGGVTQPRILMEAGYNASELKLFTAGGSSYGSAGWTERLRITSAGDVNVLGGILNLGTADVSSGHINSYELMSFNIDTDNDDGNRYFIFKKDAATAAGTELMRLTEGGNLGIGGQDPGTGDGGNSNYNNWDIPKLHVRGSSNSGKFHLLGRFHAGDDSDSTGAQIVIHHENDRGMALQGGRSSGNRSYGAIKSLDNLARESNVMVFTGGSGQGVENIKFYTNGGSTGTNERMSINTHGTVHTGGSTEITQTTLKPDLITQAGVVSPMFYRPFGGLSGAPSSSGPGYVDFGTGGVRHNLTDPHLGASYGGAQFQGGLIGSYAQTFSNTASGTTREAMNWNRFRILFRGLCLSTGHTPPTVKFRYSTYHYSNGWQDHSGTEWSFSGTEQARGGRWAVGPWINPTSYFTSWADVPGFALYYNDNSSGKTFRIAGGVYFQFAHFI